jgi:hypothetical protein
MPRAGRDWKQFNATYDMTTQKRLAAYQGNKTLQERLRRRMARIQYHFLPHYASGVPKWRLKLRSLAGERTLPDFVCVGAIKSGTSDLATYLFQHPCILPPLSKEIDSLNPQEWRPYYPTVREKEHTAREQGHALCGYFNPMLHSLLLIDNYRAVRPDAKVILMLRDPVARAYSHYKWDLFLAPKRVAKTPYYRTFADYVDFAIDLFPALNPPSVCGSQLLQTGIYVKATEMWIDRFGRDNVYILRSEDFFKDTVSAVCGIHEFLGIPRKGPEIHKIVNQNPIQAPPMEESTRRRLKEFYRPWNEQLYQLIGRNMGWDA